MNETGGGDGAPIKKDLVTSYPKGKVWYKDVKIAEWDDESKRMELLGDAKELKDKFEKLMGDE